MRRSEALKYRAAIEMTSVSLPDEKLLEVPNLVHMWENDKTCTSGVRVTYLGVLYKCLLGHTAQADRTTEAALSLWARGLIPYGMVIPEWGQPDNTNPYSKGDQVTHNGKTWESTEDDNVREPGIYGWEEIKA